MEFQSRKVAFDQSLVDKIEIAKASQSKFSDNKIPMLVQAFSLLIMNVVLLVYFILVGIEVFALILCSLAILSNIAHIVTLFCLNLRFYYAKSSTAWFIGIDFGLSLISCLIVGIGSDAIAFMILALIKAFAFALCFVAWAITTKEKKWSKLLVISMSATLLLSCGFYAFNYYNGLYGANFGFSDGNRALLYGDCEVNGQNYFSVVGVRTGAYKNCIIPEKVGGKKVEAVDLSVFEKGNFETVVLESSEKLEFLNLEEVTLNSNIQFVVDRTLIDDYKNELYSGMNKNSTYKSLADKIVPKINDNEYYITFSYGSKLKPTAIRNILETKIYDSSETSEVDLNELVKKDSVYNTLLSNKGDYKWCFENSSYLSINDFKAIGGEIKDGKISTSTVVEISFDRVYLLNVEKGNYNYTPTEWTSKVYCTESDLDISLATNRLGCTADWIASAKQKNENIGTSTDELVQFIDNLANEDVNFAYHNITLTPNWKVKDIVISSFTSSSENVVGVNNYTYGNSVDFSALIAQHELSEYMKYSFNFTPTGGNKQVIINKANYNGVVDFGGYIDRIMQVSESGTYELSVTAYDSYDERLFTTTTSEIEVSVAPKILELDWTLDDTNVYTITYDGLIHNIAASLSTQTQLVGSDIVEFNINTAQIKNANSYQSIGSFKTPQSNYSLGESAFKDFIINAKELTVDLNAENIIYNGQTQVITYSTALNQPQTYSVSGEVNGEIGQFFAEYDSASSNFKNAGSCIFKVRSVENGTFLPGNYCFANSRTDYTEMFTIKKYEVNSVNWNSSSLSLTYNGNMQSPSASFIGVGDDGEIALTVNGGKRDANTSFMPSYTAEVVNTNTNYDIAEATNLSMNYVILPYEITSVDWSNTELIYNGEPQKPSASFTGVTADGVIAMTISETQTDSNNGEAAYVANAVNPSTNYKIASTVNLAHEFNINPMTISMISWRNTNLIYNTLAQKPTASFVGAANDGIINLNVSGEEINANIGTDNYTATASILNTNYSFASANVTTTFVIRPYSVPNGEIDWLNTSNLVYNSSIQLPSASFEGLLSDGIITLSVSGGQKNVGNYVATASSPNTNYSIENSNKTTHFSISAYVVPENAITWTGTSVNYNGATQKPSASFVGVGVDGTITLEVNGTLKNAGSTTSTASISSTLTSNYDLTNANSTTTFTVNPKTLNASDVVWSASSSYYNGYIQQPVAKIEGVSVDGTLNLSVSGGQKNVGSFIVTANLDNSNYTLENATKTYTIMPATISSDNVIWSNTTVTYNSENQKPTAIVSGLSIDGNITLSVSGEQTNANTILNPTYTATATFTTSNYQFDTAATTSFVINPLEKQPIWGSTSFYFNGENQAPTATITAVDGSVINLTVSGGKINKGQYTATASCDNTNYKIASGEESIVFEILPKNVTTIVWANTTIEYDGTPKKPTAYFLDVNGESVYLTVMGEQTDVGSYTATASYSGTNYNITNANTSNQFSITEPILGE